MSVYIQLILIALATATIAMTLTKAHITEPLREWINDRSETMGYVFRCPYCASHWIAFALLMGVGGSPLNLNFWIDVCAVVAVSTLIVGLMLRCLFVQEQEIQELRDALDAARRIIRGDDMGG